MWMEYIYGFGSLYGDFWLGNEKLHNITQSKPYKLRVDMWDWTGQQSYAEYSTFKVDSWREKYKLHVRDYHGNAGEVFESIKG